MGHPHETEFVIARNAGTLVTCKFKSEPHVKDRHHWAPHALGTIYCRDPRPAFSALPDPFPPGVEAGVSEGETKPNSPSLLPLGFEPTALYDLDGTVADFDGAIRAEMEKLAAPGEKSYYIEQDDEPAHIRERRRLVKRQPGFWRNLPPFKLGMDVLAETLALGYQHMVLSKGPNSNPTAWAEKIEWVKQHLPPDVKITLTEDKGLVYGRVLVDDWPSYVTRWLRWRPRGLVIMPAHEWNVSFEHPQVIRYDGTNIGQVREALVIQREGRD
jgi:5'(3')-deoxyribonucleotidase